MYANPTSSIKPRSAALRLMPLALALAISQAYGAPVNGTPGVPGTHGATPGDSGTAGGAGGAANAVEKPAGAGTVQATAVGGVGGSGGNGAAGTVGGNGGNGGDGGAAGAYAQAVPAAAPVTVDATATGGAGGQAGTGAATGGRDGIGGVGGAAAVQATGTATGNQPVSVMATSRGGKGGASTSGTGGAGGVAAATASGSSAAGAVKVQVELNGGEGGGSANGRGGDGSALKVRNAVSGSTTGQLTLQQRAYGGTGGTGGLAYRNEAGAGGNGGDVDNALEITDDKAAELSATVSGVGGQGGYAYNGVGGKGGNGKATLRMTSTRVGAKLTGVVGAGGGKAGGSNIRGAGGRSGDAEARLVMRGQGDAVARLGARGGDEPNYSTNASRGAPGGATGMLDVVAAGNIDAESTVTGGVAWGYSSRVGSGVAAPVVTSTARAVSSGAGSVSLRTWTKGAYGTGATGTGKAAGRGGDGVATGDVGSASGDATLWVRANGGQGGVGTLGANGGDGGDAIATSGANSNTTGKLTITNTVVGGEAGTSAGGLQGRGGKAISSINVQNSDAAQLVLRSEADSRFQATASAVGTARGAVTAEALVTGPGTALARGVSTGGGDVAVLARATGDNGQLGSYSSGIAGGAGGAARLVNAVSGATSGKLTLTQIAAGGYGGDGFTNGAGGDAESSLNLADTRAGVITTTVRAIGAHTQIPTPPPHDDFVSLAGARAAQVVKGPGGSGGNARSTLVLTNVTATKTLALSEAIGGDAADGNPGGQGGEASALLTLTGKGTLEGRAVATGGLGGYSDAPSTWLPLSGGPATAQATVEGNGAIIAVSEAISGRGVRGDAAGDPPNGSKAVSHAVGRSSGAGDVSVSAYAHGGDAAGHSGGGRGGDGGGVEISGYGSSAGGRVEVMVTGGGGAGGSGGVQSKGGTVALNNAAAGATTGALVLSQSAYGGRAADDFGQGEVPGIGGDATSTLTLSDTNAASLTLTTLANGRVAHSAIDATGKVVTLAAQAIGGTGGGSTARATGTASGLAGVRADAGQDEYHPGVEARATAIAVSTGARATAHATADGKRSDALAQATGVATAGSAAQASAKGESGSAIARSATTGGTVQVTTGASAQVAGTALAITSANVGGAIPALADPAVAQAISHATALPEGAMLAGAPMLAAGTQGASYAGTGVLEYETSAGFTFDSSGGDLVLALLGATGTGMGLTQLELTVTGNGTELFSRSFSSLADAMGFFGSGSLDLGTLAAGDQHLVLTTGYTFAGEGGFAFNYAFAVAAVPEPGTWMLLLCGLALLAARAHRQRSNAG